MGGEYKDVDNDGVDENTAVTDAKKLVAWVYDNIRFRVVATANQTVTIVNVIAGRNGDNLRLVPEKETSALVPAGATSDSVLIEPIAETLPEKVSAPVKAGDVICQAKVYYAGGEITTINLVAANDVPLSVFRLIMTGVSAVITSTWFIILEVIAIIGVGIYLGLSIKKTAEKKKRAEKSNSPSDKK